MSRRHLLVSALVAGICGAILILFTDIERSLPRWLHCHSLPDPGSAEPLCRR